MELLLTAEDDRKIKEGIRDKYVKVAASPQGLFAYPTGRAGLEALGYPAEILGSLPDPVADAYCGVGNPFSLGELPEGAAILDIGCGAGVDLIVAGRLAGASGRAVGVDLVPEMIERARQNVEAAGLKNVEIVEGVDGRLEFPAQVSM